MEFPKLYKVVYTYTNVEEHNYWRKDHLVNEWLKEHCNSPYYHSPGWCDEKFIEFEDDQEATLFALKWS